MKVSNRDGWADGRTASSAALTIIFCLCIQMCMYNIVLYYSVPSGLEGISFFSRKPLRPLRIEDTRR